MSLAVDPKCLACGREPAKEAKVLYVTKGYVADRGKTWQGQKVALIARYGGKVKPRGMICAECAKQYLPESLHFEA